MEKAIEIKDADKIINDFLKETIVKKLSSEGFILFEKILDHRVHYFDDKKYKGEYFIKVYLKETVINNAIDDFVVILINGLEKQLKKENVSKKDVKIIFCKNPKYRKFRSISYMIKTCICIVPNHFEI